MLLSPGTLAIGQRSAVPAAAAMLTAVFAWIGTVAAAAALEHRSLPGPADWLLRRLAYGRRAGRSAAIALPTAGVGRNVGISQSRCPMTKTAKCAHPACECQVQPGGEFGKYCSDHCRQAGQRTELRCDCNHAPCR